MLRLDQAQRTALSDTVHELANIVAGVLVLGQLIGDRPPSLWLILAGVAVWLILMAWGVLLARRQLP